MLDRANIIRNQELDFVYKSCGTEKTVKLAVIQELNSRSRHLGI